MSYYILTPGGRIVEERDIFEWATWFENAENRRVGHTMVGEIFVSTVFLGLDHSFGNGRPLWFETMVFGEGPYRDFQYRYTTLEEAKEGHRVAVEIVRRAQEAER